MGLNRGYAANAKYKAALKYARLALPLAPDEANKTFLSKAMQQLEADWDIN